MPRISKVRNRDHSHKILLDKHPRLGNQIIIRKEKKEGEILVRKQPNLSMWDELKFEKATLDLSHLGQIKEVKLRRIENR